MLITGDIILDESTRNPWVDLATARMLRSDFAVGTLAAPLDEDATFTAPALQSAGFDALFLAPTKDVDSMRQTRELVEDTGVKTFGFSFDDDPDPIVFGETSIFGVTDCEVTGWGQLADAGYVTSCLGAAKKSVVFLHLTRRSRGPTAAANLERLKRTFVVSVGGRNPGFPDGFFAPGVFHDARRTRSGRPGLVADVDETIRRVVTQTPRPAASTSFADSIAEQALLFSLNLSRRAGLDSTLFRAPRV